MCIKYWYSCLLFISNDVFKMPPSKIMLTLWYFFKGNILRSEIDGCIQMRNFVAGHPEVKIALNEDFFVGKSDVVSRGKITTLV